MVQIHPDPPHTMPFLGLGLVIIAVGIYFLNLARRRNDRDGMIGSIGLIIAGIILVVIFGLFYRSVSLFGI